MRFSRGSNEKEYEVINFVGERIGDGFGSGVKSNTRLLLHHHGDEAAFPATTNNNSFAILQVFNNGSLG